MKKRSLNGTQLTTLKLAQKHSGESDKSDEAKVVMLEVS